MGRDEEQIEREIRITQRQLRDWLFTGGVLAVVAGVTWAWAPLGLVVLGLVAIGIALRGGRGT